MSGPGAAVVLAALAAVLTVSGFGSMLRAPRALPRRLEGAGEWIAATLREGRGSLRELASVETPMTMVRRRRLRLVAGLGGLVVTSSLVDLRVAVLASAAAAWAAPHAIAARRARYGRRVEDGAAAAALALADALSGGATARGCVADAAGRLDGPIGSELRRTAWELEVGASTDAALGRLAERAASRGVALIVAAIQVQRRCGGDLARVLRGVARALEDERRTREEARAATAQARFTAAVVMGLPVCGIALGALASPGLPGRMLASPLGVGLLTGALVLQVAGALLLRRLAGSLE